jgi:dihydroorotase, multifunctional complex type
MDILIKNVRIVDCSKDFTGDVYIKDGRISEVGENLEADCPYIDASNLVLMPSFIDLHSHFRDPGFVYKEDIESGSLAAVKGGYTAVNLMANTNPVISSMDLVDYVIQKSREVGLLDVHQAVSITRDMDGRTLDHLDSLGAEVKLLSDDGRGVEDAGVMYQAMLKAREKGLTIISHTEYKAIAEKNSRLSENLMTFRDVYLALETGCSFHAAHVSTAESMKEIIRAKKRCSNITCEVTPHHIALTDEVKYTVNPPLRGRGDVDFLIESIRDGWVDAIATDHAPHSAEDKEKGAPGISGIETAFSVCYTKLVKEGYITLGRLSELMSRNPGRIMGLNKGEIKKGFDGDVVLLDIDKKYTVEPSGFASKGKNTPFGGLELTGKVAGTIKSGKVVYDGGLKNGN